jgi:hypothetical protein
MDDEAPETVSLASPHSDGVQPDAPLAGGTVSESSPAEAVPGQPATAELSIDAKLSVISTCLTYATYEANVYWQRNAIYLTINSIMAGGIAALYEDIVPPVLIAFALFGLYLNWNWRHVNEYSKVLAERWREDARQVARSSDAISAYFRTLVGNSPIDKPSGKRPSRVMNQLSSSFKIIWGVVLIYGGVELIGVDKLTSMLENARQFLEGAP